jgi:hypothetical protein
LLRASFVNKIAKIFSKERSRQSRTLWGVNFACLEFFAGVWRYLLQVLIKQFCSRPFFEECIKEKTNIKDEDIYKYLILKIQLSGI